MDNRSIIICILLAIITTNLIRVVPMLLIKGEINNRFVRSFLYYVPYVTLAVMTFPSMIQTTISPLSGIVALLVGIIAAWRRLGLFPVAA
ncbi:MAG: AzlD domain-containing protein, partial [Prevotella sp.]|nr:AzlD domain-containing protein [Prevotella sp.]